METAASSVTNGATGALPPPGGDAAPGPAGGPPVTLESLPLDRNSPVPLYFQVAQGMERAIATGVLPAGARLENEIDLAARLGVSRPTMRRAIQRLIQDPLALKLINGDFQEGDTILVDKAPDGNELSFAKLVPVQEVQA